ncbi:MAG: type I methionyl aminopeptidase [Parcubacteria group bacterium 21-54-25]|nr:MAG: type I methionyl aminopeptidase [Parcubacteria group bacterium 21-54-25]HQU08248.1 type I methionyl aminopeptidase [Candidatus Paceibacterota bacterium]
MIVRTPKQRDTLIEAGRRLGVVLDELARAAVPGCSTEALDDLAEQLIRAEGDEPSFLGYTPEGSARPYPATVCVSINDAVVHGIPNESPRLLTEGDLVSLDLGLTHDGIIVDSAITVPVGKTDKTGYALMSATAAALEAAMAVAQPGARVGDISYATEKAFERTGFSVVKMLGGHGVGAHVHEEPFIANAGKPGTGEILVPGMVLALEPIANEGKATVVIANDGYTFRTKDGKRSAHFEHTILVETGGPLVVTRRPSEK